MGRKRLAKRQNEEGREGDERGFGGGDEDDKETKGRYKRQRREWKSEVK